MLKERINYLSYKMDISRKDLVHGLIATTHFANILAGRYPLPEDIAEGIAQRLNVTADYLVKADSSSESILSEIDNMIEKLIMGTLDVSFISGIPEYENSLILEASRKLVQASFFLSMSQKEKAEEIENSYLKFYLKQFDNSSVELPKPLKKALFYYKMQKARSENYSELALEYCRNLLALTYNDPNALIQLKTFEIESLIYTEKYEEVDRLLEKLIGYCYFEGILYYFTQLYIMYSGYLHKIKFHSKSLKYLEKAEESLRYNTQENALMYSLMIINNRILIKLHINLFDEIENDILTFERIAEKTVGNPFVAAQILTYECELYYKTKNFTKLEEKIEKLLKSDVSADQNMSLYFYLSILSMHKKDDDNFSKYISMCLPYFEEYKNVDRLTAIYKILGKQAEEKRQYKQASEYYFKLAELLEKKS